MALVLKLLVLVALSVGLPLLFAFCTPVQHATSAVLAYIRESQPMGAILCLGLETVGIMVGVPVSFMNVGVGVIFPFWIAYALTFSACFLGVSASYAVAKCCLSSEMHSAVAEKLNIDLDAALRQGPWRFTILVWVLYAPMCLKNYWLASLSIPFHIYLTVAMVNCVYMNALHVFVGSQATSVLEAWNRGSVPWYEALIAGLAVVLTIAAGVLLARFIRNSLRAGDRQVEFQNLGETP